eukprot:scaffold4201_cov31-Phaeocystis_antarctica.AAC.1
MPEAALGGRSNPNPIPNPNPNPYLTLILTLAPSPSPSPSPSPNPNPNQALGGRPPEGVQRHTADEPTARCKPIRYYALRLHVYPHAPLSPIPLSPTLKYGFTLYPDSRPFSRIMKESRNPATEERFVVRELGEEPQVIARELPFVSSKACLPIVVTLRQ